MRASIILTFVLASCGPPIRTIGLYNDTSSEITVETHPQIRYNGSLEKYIDVEPDSTERGKTWRVSDVNAIIVYPRGYYQQEDTLARYLMSPGSGFELGYAFRKTLQPEDLKIKYLKVYSDSDTIVGDGNIQIWDLLNYDKKDKRNKAIRYQKAIVLK